MEITSDKQSFINPKLIAIVAVIAAVGFVMSRMIAALAEHATLSGALWVFGASSLFLALWGLQSMAVQSRKMLIALLVIESLAVIAPFVLGASLVGIAIAAVSVGAFIVSGLRGQKDAAASLKVYSGKIVRATAPLAVSAIALLFSYAYITTITGTDLQISRKGFDALIAPLTGTARGFIPGFDITMSVNKLMEAIVLSDLPQLPAELRAAPREAKLQLVAQSRGELLKFASDRLGIAVGGSEAVGDVLYRALKSKFGQIPPQWQGPLVAGFGALVFVSVRGFGFLFNYFAAGIAWVLLQLLLARGFIKIELQSISKETVVL